MEPDPGHPGDETVRQDGRQGPVDKSIFPVPAPAGYHVVSLVNLCQQFWNIGRIILQITVHRDDDLS